MLVDLGGGLGRRAVGVPVTGTGRAERRDIYVVAELLERGDLAAARPIVDALVEAAQSAGRGASLRAGAYARVLQDLGQSGWAITVDGGQIYATAPKLGDVRSVEELTAAKDAVRGAMSARVREQVAEVGTGRLVLEVEPGVRDLIADPAALAASLRASGLEAVRPYLQLARRSDGDDPATGLPLYSVFRYLRFWWSFPFGDTPGRSLPILIRDAGQPNHPVCGLLCFASPVLRLTDRDDALGLTPAWLEAFVAGLDVDPGERRTALLGWVEAVRGLGRGGVSADSLAAALARAVGVDDRGGAGDTLRRIARLPASVWDERRWRAAERIASDLAADLRAAIDLISFDDLGVTREDALLRPAQAAEALARQGEAAKAAWELSRQGDASTRGPESQALLYGKKRPLQLSTLLAAWADLAPIREAVAAPSGSTALDALRAATSRRSRPFRARDALEAGRRASRGVSEAILARKVTLASSQIADISLCGAIPPYDGLMGGKLAALLALSREAAGAWHSAYDGVASEIQSKMAGADVRRPADLVAVTTTSLYGVGSSQYNRLALPTPGGPLRWDEVGETAGHGTMHFSRTAVALLRAIALEARGNRITALFGEGPSERMRALRDGLVILGLPADELLKHGMSRVSYVAAFRPTHPGANPGAGAHRSSGPTVQEVTEFWRERWARPRLEAGLARIERFNIDSVVLSARFPDEVNRARAAAAGAEEPLSAGEAEPVQIEATESFAY